MLHHSMTRVAAAVTLLGLLGCTQAYPAKREIETYKTQRPAWARGVAILTVDGGNENLGQPTSSQVSDTRSRAGLESLAARMQIRARAPMDIAQDNLEGALAGLELEVADLDATPDDPGEYNVIIERTEYLTDIRAEPPAQLAFEVQPAYHVRILDPSGTKTFEGTPVPVLIEDLMELDDQAIAVHAANIDESRREAIASLKSWLAEELAGTQAEKKP
jgi:hypothetical protein